MGRRLCTFENSYGTTDWRGNQPTFPIIEEIPYLEKRRHLIFPSTFIESNNSTRENRTITSAHVCSNKITLSRAKHSIRFRETTLTAFRVHYSKALNINSLLLYLSYYEREKQRSQLAMQCNAPVFLSELFLVLYVCK